MAISCWCRRATIPSARPPGMTAGTSTSWPAPTAPGISRSTRITRGSWTGARRRRRPPSDDLGGRHTRWSIASGPEPRDTPMSGFTLRDPDDIRVAVLGAGRMGRTHLSNIATIPNANVVVVADPDEASAERGRELGGAERAVADPLGAIHDPPPPPGGGGGERGEHRARG